jgi:ketosteroid isomerase-like protein
MTVTADRCSMTPRDLLAGFHRAMVVMSADDLAALHASDAVYEFPLLTPGRPERYHGRDEIRAGFAAAWSSAPVRVDEIRDIVVHQSTDPEVIIAEQRAAATILSTGRQFTLPFLLVLTARNGRIVRTRDYADALGGAKAMDRLPALVAAAAAL